MCKPPHYEPLLKFMAEQLEKDWNACLEADDLVQYLLGRDQLTNTNLLCVSCSIY